MRLGCLGCLGLLVTLALLVGIGTLSYRILAAPHDGEGTFSAEDGLRAQEKLGEILLREARLSRRRDPVVLSQSEINAFLARHLEGRRLRLHPLGVRLHPDLVEVSGGLPLDAFLQDSPRAGIRPYLPLIVLERKVWVSVRGRVGVEGREGEFRLEGWALGRQSLPVWLSGLLPGKPEGDLFRWRVPRVVDRVTVEEGRVVIHTRPVTRR